MSVTVLSFQKNVTKESSVQTITPLQGVSLWLRALGQTPPLCVPEQHCAQMDI